MGMFLRLMAVITVMFLVSCGSGGDGPAGTSPAHVSNEPSPVGSHRVDPDEPLESLLLERKAGASVRTKVRVRDEVVSQSETRYGRHVGDFDYTHAMILKAASPLPMDGYYIYVHRFDNDTIRIRLSDRCQPKTHLYPVTSYIDPRNQGRMEAFPALVTHYQLSGGQEYVWGAGEMEIKDGKIAWMSNASGHYQPPLSTVHAVADAIEGMGLAEPGSIRVMPYSTWELNAA